MIKEKEKSIVLRPSGDTIRGEVTNMSPSEVLNVLVSSAIDLAIDEKRPICIKQILEGFCYGEGGCADED